MIQKATGFLGSRRHLQTLRRWEKLARVAASAPPDVLKQLRSRARGLDERVRTVETIASLRLSHPPIGSGEMKLPPSTDWSYRPTLWRVPQMPAGHAPARNEAGFGRDVTLYHDDKGGMLTLRQMRNSGSDDLAPYGLLMDIFDFAGSFLSLVIRAPENGVEGLEKHHILRLTTHIISEQPIEITVRLNLKNGPNTEQVTRRLDTRTPFAVTEFDVAHVPFKEGRAGHLWFDLFFESPEMNAVKITDLTFSRHRRAEV